MNISPWIIYLWGIADRISTGSCILFGITVISSIVLLVVCFEDNFEYRVFRAFKWSISLCVFGGLIAIFMPTSKIIAMMTVIPKIAQSTVIQKDLPELYSVAIEALKQKISGTQTNK